jgi:hypothetical protein
MIENLPAPIALIFGGYVLGVGYLALLSFLGEKNFIELDNLDKLIISLVFGVLSFSFILIIFGIKMDFENSLAISEILRMSPLLFIINIFFARILLSIWVFMQHNIFTPYNSEE